MGGGFSFHLIPGGGGRSLLCAFCACVFWHAGARISLGWTPSGCLCMCVCVCMCAVPTLPLKGCAQAQRAALAASSGALDSSPAKRLGPGGSRETPQPSELSPPLTPQLYRLAGGEAPAVLPSPSRTRPTAEWQQPRVGGFPWLPGPNARLEAALRASSVLLPRRTSTFQRPLPPCVSQDQG